MATDIGQTLHVTMTDGRTLELRPIYGDMVRAEQALGVPIMQMITDGFTTTGAALLAYHSARRNGMFSGSQDEWLSCLGNVDATEDTPSGNGNRTD
jgi:hypothetical protein